MSPAIRHIRILALLSSVRWYNIILIALAQYLCALFVFNSFPLSIPIVLFDLKLHLLVVCSLLTIAAGFLINDFYDFRKDLINRPKVTLFKQYISKDLRIRLYFYFNAAAWILAFIGSWKILLFFAFLSFSLWFYSHKLSKYPFIKEVSASLLSVSCFFSIGFHYGYVDKAIVFYGIYFLMTVFTRAIIKDVQELKGDLAIEKQSIPGFLGDNKTRLVIVGSILIQLLYSVVLYVYFFPANWLYLIFFSNIIVTGCLVWLKKIKTGEFYILNFVYKLLILMGIFNLVFF